MMTATDLRPYPIMPSADRSPSLRSLRGLDAINFFLAAMPETRDSEKPGPVHLSFD